MSPINKIVKDVLSKKMSALQSVKAAINRAKDDKYNSVLSICEENAIARAKQIDDLVSQGDFNGRLAGVPFVAKDNILTFGSPTTAASHMLENFTAPYQAEVIERLEAEGAILIGKANLDAFAHGGSTENSAFGASKNPNDITRIPGGSSGGSAVAVAADIVPFALGTDTGGSIRLPASFCGVIGMKPSYGRVSRYGAVAMASSTDCIGPIAKDPTDIDLLMQIIAGNDEKDSTTFSETYINCSDAASQDKKRFAVVKEQMSDGVSPDVRQAIDNLIQDLKQKGHIVDEVSMPSSKYALATYYVIVPAEIASNLARYDGIHYGTRVNSQSLSDVYTHSRQQGFMPENKRRILIGNYVLSSGYYDAYFERAQRVRTLIINDYQRIFSSYDAIIGPVAPTTAPRIGEKSDPVTMYLMDIMTVMPSLAGLPAIGLPIASDQTGLPIGLQIIGKPKHDGEVVALAKEISQL